ncbi:DNRLRE domain-containing protein [Flagellimonas oceanensis]|uniref:DNRLRE domain-containing protein n=1 Tax=Flagellimonas oceanensis TaxID=2499163 RepID=UPI003BA992AA
MKTKLLIFVFFCIVGCGKEESRRLMVVPNPQTGQDAIISRAHKKNNYGNLEILHLTSRIKQDTLLDDNRFVIGFNLEQINKWAKVDSAFIYLYRSSDEWKGPNPFLVHRVKEPWIEHRITWDNQPTVAEQRKVLVSDTETKELKIEVSPLVRGFVEREYRNMGFMFRLAEEDHKGRKVSFMSSNSKYDSLRPRLEIYYRVKDWF